MASPRTSSPSFHSVTPSPAWTTCPENSTPRIVGAPGGMGYMPSRWRMSIRLRPNALTYVGHVLLLSTLGGSSGGSANLDEDVPRARRRPLGFPEV